MPGVFVVLVLIAAICAIAALLRSEGPLTAVAVLLVCVALLAGR